jgi:ankyrin repeat protein
MKGRLILIMLIVPAIAFSEKTLFAAAENGDVAFIKGYRGDVDAADDIGRTALMYAAERGQTAAVKALLKAKANINAANKYGWTALMFAADNGRTETLKALLAAKADANAADNEGTTALMLAALKGKPDMVKALLEAKAEVNAVNKKGWTPLNLATDPAVIKLLKESGAKE